MSIAKALVAAQKEAHAVAKTSVNNFHRYKYASAEAMIAEGRECLANAGLALIVTSWEVVPSEVPSVESKVVVGYSLHCDSTDDVLTFRCETSIIPEKGRPQDKAEATALTYNLGYFLRGLLLLPREDAETSVDARDDRDKEPKTINSPVDTVLATILDEIASANTLDKLRDVKKKAGDLGLLDDNRFRRPWVEKHKAVTGVGK